MDIIVGIDVSKDRLDVHVMPAGDSFFVCNGHAGIDGLLTRLAGLSPHWPYIISAGRPVRSKPKRRASKGRHGVMMIIIEKSREVNIPGFQPAR